MLRVFTISLFAGALPLAAQAVIDPGMPQAKVIARLGAPAVERSSGDATYLFYTNGCERVCGMHDVVLLEKGVVVDAVLRTGKRRYSGTSSSPRMIPAAEARRARPTTPAESGDGPITIQIKSVRPPDAPADFPPMAL